jgi:gamma-glutamyltranspeptidase/glutathione hydrolase
VVAAGHPLSARAGAEALARGGGAVDAACAAVLAACVTESPLTGPAAGGFMMVRPPGGPATLLDFFVAVPGLGPGGRRLDPADLDVFTVPFGGADQDFHIGSASVAVPGLVPGLADAAARFGRLALADLTAPAARLARDGVAVSEQGAYLRQILHDMLTHTPETARIYEPEGRPPRPGEVLRMPELADALEELGRSGGRALRDGPLARATVSYLAASGGLVTAEDLAGYRVIERTPLEVGYRDLTVLTNPPPSSGGVLIAAALRTLAAEPPPRDDIHHYLAIARAGAAANALRNERFARELGEEDFLERFWARVAAGARGRPCDGGGETPALGSTTHVSAIDAEGGMASCSSSNGSGSGVIVPGTGILLNNMLGEEDLNPGGFGGGEPGVRMTSMMAPSLVLRGGEPLIALGSAGSNRLRSAILQTLVSAVDGGLDPAAAVRRPRVHPEGDGVDLEGGTSDAVAAALEAAGHRVRRWSGLNLFFGGVSMAAREPGGVAGAGDPRRAGGAAGVTRAGEVVAL